MHRKKLCFLFDCLPTPVLSGSGHEGLDLSNGSSPSTLAIINLLKYNVKWNNLIWGEPRPVCLMAAGR